MDWIASFAASLTIGEQFPLAVRALTVRRAVCRCERRKSPTDLATRIPAVRPGGSNNIVESAEVARRGRRRWALLFRRGTISCVSAPRRKRDKSSLISDKGTFFTPDFRIVQTGAKAVPPMRRPSKRSGRIVCDGLRSCAMSNRRGDRSPRQHVWEGPLSGPRGRAARLAPASATADGWYANRSPVDRHMRASAR